jgi:outer membrane protein
MRKYLIIIFTMIISCSLFAQKKLTLDEAVSIALQRNSNLIKTSNNVDINKSQVKSAYGDLLPDFGLTGRWGWSRNVDEVGTVVFQGQELDIGTFSRDVRTYSLSAGGGITLFNGLANYKRIGQSEDELDAAEYNLEKVKQDIVLNTIDLYYGVLKAKSLLKVREDNLEFNKKLFETIDERNRLGVIPIADVYTQQVQLGNAQLAVIQAENAYQNFVSNFLDFLALDVLEEYEFENPFGSLDDPNYDDLMDDFSDLGSMVQEALANRYDYKAQKASVSSAERGVGISYGGLFPILSGSYGFSTNVNRADDLFDQRSWSVGLSLNFPIFSNWNTETQIQIAKVQEKNAYEDLSALERLIKIEVKQGYLNLSASKKALEVSNNNVQAAGENRRVNTERYNLGSGTILDVLQADKDYTDALNNKIESTYQFLIDYDDLKNRLGKLDYQKYE